MDQNTLAIYIHELRNLCLHTQASFDLFNNAMRSRAGGGILFGGQMILMPTSQIAALLWPSKARSRKRGESLRQILGLPEKHALNDRRLAELWERADEKMEDWIASTKGERVIFDFIGNPASLGEDVKITGIYRAYDPNSRVFYYRGTGYGFQALAEAMTDVGTRVNAVYVQLFPEQAKAEAEARARADAARQAQMQQAAAQNTETAPEKTEAPKTEAPKTETPKTETKAAKTAKKTPPKKTAAKKAAEKA